MCAVVNLPSSAWMSGWPAWMRTSLGIIAASLLRFVGPACSLVSQDVEETRLAWRTCGIWGGLPLHSGVHGKSPLFPQVHWASWASLEPERGEIPLWMSECSTSLSRFPKHVRMAWSLMSKDVEKGETLRGYLNEVASLPSFASTLELFHEQRPEKR